MRTNTSDWQQAFALADEAFDLSPAERERWLENLRPDQAHLKPLLVNMFADRARMETDNFLNGLPQFTIMPELIGAAAQSSSTKVTQQLAAGMLIGAYRLIREIGVGGMGAVWLAERADGAIKRVVALKLPYAGPFQQQIVERFDRERDILAALTHKNIARLYDAGVSETGQPYLAMEYVEGVPINDYCDQKQLSIAARLQLFRQVLSAVQYAHANLVLHRDLKPSNILVSQSGTVSLLDFGIAKVMSGSEAVATQLTEIGGRALTPDYASPEQISGAALSTSSDVYSLGVILYELLAGSRPYRLRRGTRGELEEAITSADATRPSQLVTQRNVANAPADKRQVTPKKLAQLLMGDLDTIVLKALKKKPAERYATVAALDEDIARHLRGDAVLARPDSRWYRLQKFVVRNKLAAGSVLAVLLALSVGMGSAMWQAQKARMQAGYSEARATFLADLFADPIPKSREVPMPTVKELLRIGESSIERSHPGQLDVQAKLYADLGRAMRVVGDYKNAIPMYERALQKTEEYYGINSNEATEIRVGVLTRYGWAMHHRQFFAFEKTGVQWCATVADFAKDQCPRLAVARQYAYFYSGRFADGERLAAQDMDWLRQQRSARKNTLNALTGFVTRSRAIRGDVVAARPAALQVVRHLSENRKGSCIDCLYYVTQLMTSSGNFAAAKPYAEEFLRQHDAGTGDENYIYNDSLRAVAQVHFVLGAHEKSEHLYRRAIDASRDNYGPANTDLAMSLRELAYLLIETGRRDEARDALEEAARIYAAVDAVSGTTQNRWSSEVRIALAGIDVMSGNISGAQTALAAQQKIAIDSQDDANLALSLYWLARIANDDADALEALRVLRRGGRDRTPLALDLNLLLTERSKDKSAREQYASRAVAIAHYVYGAEHARTKALVGKLAVSSSVQPLNNDMDKAIDAQDRDIIAYADDIMRALGKGKP